MKYFSATVIWFDCFTHDAAVLIDGRLHTTLVRGAAVEPGQRVYVTEAGFMLTVAS